jgi:hypothetical protein
VIAAAIVAFDHFAAVTVTRTQKVKSIRQLMQQHEKKVF